MCTSATMLIQADFRLLTLLLYAIIVPTENLVCYDCRNVADTKSCHTTKTCEQDESCFMDWAISSNGSLITLGCIANKQCNTHVTTGGAIIGRSLTKEPEHRCYECCSSNVCAAQLCTHLAPTLCVDDQSLDCSRMNSLFDICSDIKHAKSVCPRFCGLCDTVDGQWSSWSTWTNCSVTCENGTQIRTRTCTNPSPVHGGENCFGKSKEIKQCTKKLCPIDGTWTSWSTWTNCSVTCENGTQIRTRTCTNPSPAHGGEKCHGTNSEVKSCTRELCPVHGGWTDWFPWGSCSVTCDVGLQRRTRNCSNPAPSRFGDHCFGDRIDDRLCLPGACVDGGWSTWSEWSNCSAVTLCAGIKTRSRTCSNPFPSPYGKNCLGNTMQINSCNIRHCFISANDCWDVKRLEPGSPSGLYRVSLWKANYVVEVYCDMDTDNGGWTVFQRRFNGSVDFYRTFGEYENGFGYKDGEFWLGLKTIQEMTTNGKNELRIDLTAANGSNAYEVFQNFYLSPGSSYTLHIDRGTGTAGDSNGLSYNNGYNFATRDKDYNSCSVTDHGGWWYNGCTHANLNGRYVVPGTMSSYNSGEGGVIYRTFQGVASLKSTVMMFRRVQ